MLARVALYISSNRFISKSLVELYLNDIHKLFPKEQISSGGFSFPQNFPIIGLEQVGPSLISIKDPRQERKTNDSVVSCTWKPSGAVITHVHCLSEPHTVGFFELVMNWDVLFAFRITGFSKCMGRKQEKNWYLETRQKGNIRDPTLFIAVREGGKGGGGGRVGGCWLSTGIAKTLKLLNILMIPYSLAVHRLSIFRNLPYIFCLRRPPFTLKIMCAPQKIIRPPFPGDKYWHKEPISEKKTPFSTTRMLNHISKNKATIIFQQTCSPSNL